MDEYPNASSSSSAVLLACCDSRVLDDVIKLILFISDTVVAESRDNRLSREESEIRIDTAHGDEYRVFDNVISHANVLRIFEIRYKRTESVYFSVQARNRRLDVS